MRLRYSAEARDDIAEIFNYINDRNSSAAAQVVARIRFAAERLAESLRKGGNPWFGGGRRAGAEKSDGWLLARLRARSERPHRRTATEKSDELAPTHASPMVHTYLPTLALCDRASNEKWTAIKPMLTNKSRGVRRIIDRRVLNGMYWVLGSGAPWRDLRMVRAQLLQSLDESTPYFSSRRMISTSSK